MTTEKALRALWADLKAQYADELDGVTFTINGRLTSRLGRCQYRREPLGGAFKVEVARWIVEADEEQAFDTLLHETAHALAGHSAGHGPKWKAWCREIGAKPERCVMDAAIAAQAPARQAGPKYLLTCQECGHEHKRQRLTRKMKLNLSRYSCQCGGKLDLRQLR